MLHRGILAWVYSLTAVLGVGTIFFPSESIEGAIGAAFTYLYGILLLVGAVGALIAIARPNYRFELIFLWPIAGGYASYAVALWSLFSERIGVMDGLAPPYGPAIVATVLTLFLIAKILLLIRKNRELVKAVENNGLD